jgi:hypothetical protein
MLAKGDVKKGFRVQCEDGYSAYHVYCWHVTPCREKLAEETRVKGQAAAFTKRCRDADNAYAKLNEELADDNGLVSAKSGCRSTAVSLAPLTVQEAMRDEMTVGCLL